MSDPSEFSNDGEEEIQNTRTGSYKSIQRPKEKGGRLREDMNTSLIRNAASRTIVYKDHARWLHRQPSRLRQKSD